LGGGAVAATERRPGERQVDERRYIGVGLDRLGEGGGGAAGVAELVGAELAERGEGLRARRGGQGRGVRPQRRRAGGGETGAVSSATSAASSGRSESAWPSASTAPVASSSLSARMRAASARRPAARPRSLSAPAAATRPSPSGASSPEACALERSRPRSAPA